MKLLMLAALLLPGMALAQSGLDLGGIPENCQAPLAHDMEMTAIPQLLGLSGGAAHIAKITTIRGTNAYGYGGGYYRIDCMIDVLWSNGATDREYVFSAWQDRYGQFQGSYAPVRDMR